MNTKRNILGLTGLTALVASPAFAQEAMTLDQKVNDAFAASTGWFVNLIFAPFPGTSFPWIVMWLVIAATIFTVYFGFVQFRFFKHAIQL
ncbi:MAG: sodium:alanine symporter, partial [Pacificibacter sp.]